MDSSADVDRNIHQSKQLKMAPSPAQFARGRLPTRTHLLITSERMLASARINVKSAASPSLRTELSKCICECIQVWYYTPNHIALCIILIYLTGARPYKCDECGREFRQWGDLKYHYTSLHSGVRQYQW